VLHNVHSNFSDTVVHGFPNRTGKTYLKDAADTLLFYGGTTVESQQLFMTHLLQTEPLRLLTQVTGNFFLNEKK
jgi:hypothetical protein